MAKSSNSRGAGQMSVQDAGRKGGQKTASTYGRQFYQEIGRKGGEARGSDADVKNGEMGLRGDRARAKSRRSQDLSMYD